MTLFSKHRAIFGEPGKGVHSARVFGVASVDLFATLIAALALALWATAMMPMSIGGPAALLGRVVWRTGVLFALLMVLAVALHWLFGVDTAMMAAIRRQWRRQ